MILIRINSNFVLPYQQLIFGGGENGNLKLKDQCTWEEEQDSELKTVFLDGKLVKDWTLAEIRARVAANIKKAVEALV
jgi:nicotinamide phosphoribosyltransferase